MVKMGRRKEGGHGTGAEVIYWDGDTGRRRIL
jgi:hypothetical protein